MSALQAPNSATCDFCQERSANTISMRRIVVCSDCVSKIVTKAGAVAPSAGLTLHGDVRAADPASLFRPGGRTMSDGRGGVR